MNKIYVALIFCFAVQQAVSQLDAYQYRIFHRDDDSLNYRILMPKEFDKAERYPLVIFLHGAGERGSDNESQLVHGGKLFADSIAQYPAIVIFPQCPESDYWANVQIESAAYGRNHFFTDGGRENPHLAMVGELIDSLMKTESVNADRIYIGGLSMGGMGVFEIVYRKPDTFAAAFSICGGGNMDSAKKYAKTTAFWIFHGAKDDVVLPYHSIKMRKAINDAAGVVKLTIYPKANHNSWDSAFAEPELLEWLFSCEKKIAQLSGDINYSRQFSLTSSKIKKHSFGIQNSYIACFFVSHIY